MFVTVINDCQSQNDIARQETRLISLFSCPISFVGVDSDFSVNATLEASGTLIDVLDAAEDRPGLLLVNVAPRGEQKKDGDNGTSFCFFSYKNVLVISTVRGQTLSLIKKLHMTDSIKVVSVEEVMRKAKEQGLATEYQASYVPTSQFRSYDFTPRLAYWLHSGHEIPHQPQNLDIIDDVGPMVWYKDAFGNLKTTITESEITKNPGEKMKTNVGDFTFYKRLKDIPKGETACYIGSSGIEGNRFMEIATQMTGGSAAKTLGIGVGQPIIIED